MRNTTKQGHAKSFLLLAKRTRETTQKQPKTKILDVCNQMIAISNGKSKKKSQAPLNSYMIASLYMVDMRPSKKPSSYNLTYCTIHLIFWTLNSLYIALKWKMIAILSL